MWLHKCARLRISLWHHYVRILRSLCYCSKGGQLKLHFRRARHWTYFALNVRGCLVLIVCYWCFCQYAPAQLWLHTEFTATTTTTSVMKDGFNVKCFECFEKRYVNQIHYYYFKKNDMPSSVHCDTVSSLVVTFVCLSFVFFQDLLSHQASKVPAHTEEPTVFLWTRGQFLDSHGNLKHNLYVIVCFFGNFFLGLFNHVCLFSQVVRNPMIEKPNKDGKPPTIEYQEEEMLVSPVEGLPVSVSTVL